MGERLIRIEDGADGVRVLTLARPPVNALTNELLDELEGALDSVEWDGCAAAVLTGDGAFFSFGFDVPLLMTMEREAVHAFVERFCALYLRLFALDCPLVTAINGHATAGGCILAMTGDTRLMVEGRAEDRAERGGGSARRSSGVSCGCSAFSSPARPRRGCCATASC